MTTTEQKEEIPSYYGHRARLRERFMVDEGASMPDYELLELLLTMAIPRRDVKPLAKNLLKKFDDIKNVLHTPAHRLLEECNLPPTAIVLFRLIHTCMLRSSYAGFMVSDEPLFSSWEYFEEFCWNSLAYKEVEEFWVFFLDESNHYKGSKHLSTGTINKAVVHPREILRSAIESKAAKIVLAHNHPSGSIKPSDFDKAITAEIEALSEMMDFILEDHLIIAKEGIFSFKANGLIKPKEKSEDATGRFDKKKEAKNKELSNKKR